LISPIKIINVEISTDNLIQVYSIQCNFTTTVGQKRCQIITWYLQIAPWYLFSLDHRKLGPCGISVPDLGSADLSPDSCFVRTIDLTANGGK